MFKFELKNGEKHIIKIIPLELEPTIECDVYPLPININAAIHECSVLNEISGLMQFRRDAKPQNYTGFNNNLGICVVKGQYPKDLINYWMQWNEEKFSENNCPGKFKFILDFLIHFIQIDTVMIKIS